VVCVATILMAAFTVGVDLLVSALIRQML
jgi:preprotein translocase subunit SecE